MATERSLRLLCLMCVAACIGLGVSGCTTSKKLWQVLKDPSTPVGELRDQPSQIALSLVAAADMNPNLYPPAEAGAVDPALPYRVNLSGDDLDDLARQLKAALQQVESERRGTSGATTPADLTDVQVASQEATVTTGDGVPRQLGQYREGHGDEDLLVHPTSVLHASPLDVKVIQLKDDGHFMGADFDALGKDPEKTLGKTYLAHDEFVLQPGQYKFVRFFPVQEHTHYIAVVASYHDLDTRVWKAIARIEPTGGKYPLLVRLDRRSITLQHEH